MTNLEDYENFKKNHQSRKVYDVQSLLSVGETMRFYEEQGIADRAVNVAKSVYNGAVSQTAGGVLRGLQWLRDWNEAQLNADHPERMQMDEGARALLDNAANADFLKPYEVRADSGAERFVYDLAQGAGQLAGQVAISALPGGRFLTMPAMALQIGGEEYKELREKGVDVETAGQAAAFNAAVQTPLEYIGFSKLTKAIPANTMLRQRLRKVGEDVFTEGVTEFLQEYPEQASKLWAENADGSQRDAAQVAKEIFQTMREHKGDITPDAIYSGVIGGTLGWFASGAHLALDRNIERAMQREVHKTMTEHIEGTVNRIKESGINPQYAVLVENDNTDGMTVYVDGEALQAYAQEAGEEKLAESLGVTVEEIKNAAENGDTVDIKLGNFEATGAAFDGFLQAVGDDTAFEDGGYTVNKDKQEQEQIKQYREEENAIRAEKDRIKKEWKEAGVDSQTATLQLALLESWARKMPDPVAAMKKLGVRYGGDGSAATGNLAQSMFDVRKAGAKSVLDLKNRIDQRRSEGQEVNKLQFSSDNGIRYAESEVYHATKDHGITDEEWAD